MPYVAVVYIADPAIARALQKKGANRDIDVGRVVGLYRFPSYKDVECPGWKCPHATKKGYSYGRHPRHGYIVHGACQRREIGFRERIHRTLLDLFGLNLMPRDTTPRVFRNPERWDPR